MPQLTDEQQRQLDALVEELQVVNEKIKQCEHQLVTAAVTATATAFVSLGLSFVGGSLLMSQQLQRHHMLSSQRNIILENIQGLPFEHDFVDDFKPFSKEELLNLKRFGKTGGNIVSGAKTAFSEGVNTVKEVLRKRQGNESQEADSSTSSMNMK